MIKRVLKGVASSYYGQLVTILFQLVSVPLFLEYWGLEKYAHWLVLYAIPSMIVLMEFGVFNVITNLLSRKKELLLSLTSTVNSIFIVISILLALVFLSSDSVYLLCILYATLLLYFNFLTALYRIELVYHIGSTISNTARLIEFSCILLCVYFNHSIIVTFCSLIVVRIIFIIISVSVLKRYKIYSTDLKKISVKNLKEIPLNDLKFTFYYQLGLIINNQGLIFIINQKFGAASLVVFNTLRVLFRLSNQFVGAFNSPLFQEYTKLACNEEESKLIDIFKKSLIVTFVSVLGLFLIFFLYGECFLRFWLKNEYSNMAIPEFYFIFMLIASMLNVLWQPIVNLLMAIAQYRFFSCLFLNMQAILCLNLLIISDFVSVPVVMLLIDMLFFITLLFYVKYLIVNRKLCIYNNKK
ncbi:hypothetical protein [Pseudoalteromonas sp. TAB23]|uniref:lipopolysaccharide biosynthesis protein n=1 Tax=Pseudoalteromonas sp. TAB23 TaxID=1938595 RepID=UPI0003FE2479|nr:hypothetical protein [Pseudoalteromonas sp. TAB23]